MNGDKHWTENFRVLTPILVTVAIFLLGSLVSTVNKIDDKLFKHLTNDGIHTPREFFISKAEFNIYREFRNKELLFYMSQNDKDHDKILADLGEIKKWMIKK